MHSSGDGASGEWVGVRVGVPGFATFWVFQSLHKAADSEVGWLADSGSLRGETGTEGGEKGTLALEAERGGP